MKDPGPHPVELLNDITKGSGLRSVSRPGLHSLQPILLPAIFFDDCSGTLPYQNVGTGADWQIAYVTDAPYVGLNGLKVETKPTDPAENDYARAEIQMPANEFPILRFQALVTRAITTSTNFITSIAVTADDGAQGYLAEIQIDWNTPAFSYSKKVNAGFEITPIDDWHPNYQDKGWNHVQLAINMATGSYHEIIMNGKRHSIPTEPMGLVPTTNWAPFIKLWLQTQAVAAAQAATYFDQILVTAEREP